MEPSLSQHPSRTLSSLWWAMLLVSCPFGILSFVLPIYGKELGATALEVGAFFSALSFVPVIVRPFLGRALDRWGRQPFLLLGLGSYAAAMVVFLF
jgi:MFS family permease